jgi:MFS family permease
VIIAYMLTVALLIPASGWIADRFGTKKIFFGAILLFSIGSLLCALSTSLTMLIGAGHPGPGRCADAAGRAAGGAAGLSAFGAGADHGFHHHPGLLGPLIGPTMGGWMVEYLTWHWIFLINLPVG